MIASALAALCLVAPPKLGRVERHSLTARFTAPGFYANNPPRLIDRDRLVVIGVGSRADPEAFHLVDLKTLERVVVRAPLQAFAAEHPELALKPTVDGLLCYDTEQQTAHVAVEDMQGARVVVHWDLKAQRITRATPLMPPSTRTEFRYLHPIGYSPERRECYVETMYDRTAASQPSCGAIGPVTVKVVALGETVREVASFVTTAHTGLLPVYDAPRNRSLHREYTECPSDPEAKGRLIDLASGALVELTLPRVNYGAVFSPDGRTLNAYSELHGALWSIDLESRERTGLLEQVGRQGYGLGLFDDRTLVLIRPKSIAFFERATLRAKGSVPTASFAGRVSNVHTSIAAGRVVVLRAFDDLWLAELK